MSCVEEDMEGVLVGLVALVNGGSDRITLQDFN